MDRKAPPTPSGVISTQLKILRTRKQWTQQQLAERLEQLGFAMDRSVIAKVELFKREVSANELIAFATALGVSPLSLVVPREGKTDDEYPAIPSVTVTVPQFVLMWQGVSPDDDTERARFFRESLPDVLSNPTEPEFADLWRTSASAVVESDRMRGFSFIEDLEDTLSSLLHRLRRDPNWLDFKEGFALIALLRANPELQTDPAKLAEASGRTPEGLAALINRFSRGLEVAEDETEEDQ